MAKIDFGYILRRLRHDREETLEQVSEATGLSVAMLSRIERGERLPSPDSVEVLAKHFDLPVDYLMSETIARRLLNRYGEESAKSAAAHMQREPEELGILAAETDESSQKASRQDDDEPRRLPRREPRRYGPFQERDMLAAIAAINESRQEPPAEEARRGIAPVAPSVPAAPVAPRDRVDDQTLRLVPPSSLGFLPSPASDRTPEPSASTPRLDPATEQVLRAAREASEAAAVLVRREAPALSREARLELVDRIAPLAEQATEVLQMLLHDPEPRVRAAARDALRRLMRGL